MVRTLDGDARNPSHARTRDERLPEARPSGKQEAVPVRGSREGRLVQFKVVEIGIQERCPRKPIDYIRDSLSGLWYTDSNNKRGKTKWYGAVYTPSMWTHPAGSIGPGSYAEIPWSQRGALVKLDSYDYEGKVNATRSTTIILFCMAGTWTFWEPRDWCPDRICRGSHDRGTPGLFADMHVQFVTYDKVGKL